MPLFPESTLAMFSDRTPTLEWEDETHWKVAQGFVYTSPTGTVVTVPDGMITDLASIPRLFWNIYPPQGPYLPAALVHDYLYASHRAGSDLFTRKQADQILLAGMEELGVSWLTQTVVYRAVRLGGWGAWERQD